MRRLLSLRGRTPSESVGTEPDGSDATVLPRPGGRLGARLAGARSVPRRGGGARAQAGPSRAHGAPVLQTEALCSGYGALQVLFGVSLEVGPGEVVALMGSNGAGKTTTLRTITGLLRPMSGRVLLDGQDVTGRPPEALVRRGLVMVPEGRGMLRDLTVAENLQLGAYSNVDSASVSNLLEQTFTTFPILAERRQQRAGTLSGGQQQMLALGRALMANPKLMLVDEASLGLSPIMTETAFNLIAEVNQVAGVAVLIVEQNVLALDLASRAYVLEKGQIVATAEGVGVRSMQGRLREAYLGSAAR